MVEFPKISSDFSAELVTSNPRSESRRRWSIRVPSNDTSAPINRCKAQSCRWGIPQHTLPTHQKTVLQFEVIEFTDLNQRYEFMITSLKHLVCKGIACINWQCGVFKAFLKFIWYQNNLSTVFKGILMHF